MSTETASIGVDWGQTSTGVGQYMYSIGNNNPVYRIGANGHLELINPQNSTVVHQGTTWGTITTGVLIPTNLDTLNSGGAVNVPYTYTSGYTQVLPEPVKKPRKPRAPKQKDTSVCTKRKINL